MSTIVINTANALGDFVLSWPILRSIEPPSLLVAHAEKSELARVSLGVTAHALHAPPWNGLLQGRASPELRGVSRFISIGPMTPQLREAVQASSMGAEAEMIETSAPLDRVSALAWARRLVSASGDDVPRSVPVAGNSQGPITLHVGSGGRAKRWPLDRWLSLAGALSPTPTRVVAGEVEAEQWPSDERRAFLDAGGVFIDALSALRRVLLASRLVVAADCGPGHLAAALGVPTLSLFGPTDPGVWAPLGGVSSVLAPPAPMPMGWLSVEAVLATVRSLDDLFER